VRPGGAVIIYGALAGPVLELNILDVFLGKQLQVIFLLVSGTFLHGFLHAACTLTLIETIVT
jgi:hypothetical protein